MRNIILKNSCFLFASFVVIIFSFNSFAYSQTYELLCSRFSAGGGEQKSANYDVQSSTGGMTKNKATSTNYEIQTACALPDSVPSVPFVDAVSMVSFPLILENGDAYSLFGSNFDIAKWFQSENAYHYYSKNANDSLLQFNAGQGYWVKLDSAKTINVYGSLISQSSDYAIPLKAGWNQIGNPFNFNINFADIKVIYNGEIKTLTEAANAHWIGNYALAYPNQTTGYQLVSPTITGASKVLEPWLGYWVNSAFDLEILIPPTKAVKAKDVSSDNFSLKVIASVDDLTSNIIIGKDEQTQLIPLPSSPWQNNLEIHLQENDNCCYLAMFNNSLDYEFIVKAAENKKVKLEFIGGDLSNNYLYLVDEQTNKESEVTNTSYEFIANGSEQKFKLQISKVNKTLLSQSMTLEKINIFPNPLTKNSNINIEAKFLSGLPVNASLEIYNTNGKLITKENVIPEYQSKNKVKLSSPNLNIINLPNGIYFGRITFYNANNEKVSKVVKIAVVK